MNIDRDQALRDLAEKLRRSPVAHSGLNGDPALATVHVTVQDAITVVEALERLAVVERLDGERS